MQVIAPDVLQAQLSQDLVLWQVNNNALERVYRASSYLEALDKLNIIAQHAEAVNHHPDLALHWKTLIIRYWTHTANGVTALDLEQAQQVEKLLN